jgi:hypothetical protein
MLDLFHAFFSPSYLLFNIKIILNYLLGSLIVDETLIGAASGRDICASRLSSACYFAATLGRHGF